MASATPRKLALWEAYYRHEPWQSESWNAAQNASLLTGVISMLAATHGQKAEVTPPSKFMPPNWDNPEKVHGRAKKRVRDFASISAFQAKMAKEYGK